MEAERVSPPGLRLPGQLRAGHGEHGGGTRGRASLLAALTALAGPLPTARGAVGQTAVLAAPLGPCSGGLGWVRGTGPPEA